ncbi:hypothetical protein N7466_009466 [Penicillium verhagenii]|uniref:uncharacterized protein n=1 Tax=Penicillium verhagenii TaxID=1562060 RepID=UPI0025458EB7|nr:uncharacterized protein N7466_009466 [Penicillium verhagenii]KAJ5921140.1 hypothetical protein N7466_009466 [Penicillium verhagenii]
MSRLCAKRKDREPERYGCPHSPFSGSYFTVHPGWTETNDPSSVTPTANKPDGADVHAFYKPFSQLYPDFTAQTVNTVQVKTKVKTRVKQQENAASIAEVDIREQPNPPRSHHSFPVDAHALRLFKVLFFTPSTISTPGEIAWNAFLYTMRSVGFAVTKLCLPAWQFESNKLDIYRDIQFHESHS